jgi:hypothetical protein
MNRFVGSRDEGFFTAYGYVCMSCRARIPGVWKSTCRELFRVIVEKELSEPTTYGSVHTLTIACYALQHPRQHDPHILAWRLVELCWVLKHGGDPSLSFHDSHIPGDGFSGWLESLSSHRMDAPAFRGAMTIIDIGAGRSAEEHCKLVYQWARSVWSAWSQHHRWAKKTALELSRYYHTAEAVLEKVDCSSDATRGL